MERHFNQGVNETFEVTLNLPVAFNTPLESSVKYVGISGKGMKMSHILEVLFDKDFKVLNNKISKIGQFESNLPQFEYLNEVKSLNKKGKWYAFTNSINKHLLDYDFKQSDYVSLSYILGSELANQQDSSVYNFRESIDTGDHGAIYPLGNIYPNSEINFQIKPLKRFGEKIKHVRDTVF